VILKISELWRYTQAGKIFELVGCAEEINVNLALR
jgi:hypothetical protein